MDNTSTFTKSSYILLNFDNYIHTKLNVNILKFMNNDFEQISLKQGFMKHNGGVLFKTLSESEYLFKTTIKENHLNAAGIAHGGFIAAFVDAGAGTAAHRSAENSPCVTISLDLKFVSAASLGQKLLGKVKIQKKTRTLVFATCEISSSENIVATASGVWKILKT